MFLQSRLGVSTIEPSTPVSQSKAVVEPQSLERNKCTQVSCDGYIRRTPSSSFQQRTPRKTPGSTCKTPNSKAKTPSKYTASGDRLIPSRSNINIEVAHFKLVNEEPKGNTSPTKLEEEKQFKENLDPSLSDAKILPFKIKTPRSARGNLKATVLDSQSLTPASLRKLKDRYIPQAPERILDAPDFVNDYYLNLLDWGGGSLLAVALRENVYIWDAKTGSIVHLCQLNGLGSYVSSVKWEKSNGYLAVGTSDKIIELWDVERSKRLRQMSGHAARVGSLSWNSHILSSGSRSGAIHNHDVRIAQHQVGAFSKHTQEVCGLEWSLEGRYLASGGNDNLLNVWDGNQVCSRKPIQSFTHHTAGVKALAWCPWQSSILASGGGSADRCIRFWNVNSGECLNSVDTKSQVCGLVWSKRYKELVSGHGYSQNQLTVWKYPSMKRVSELTGHSNRVLQLTISNDETFVMSAAADETLRLWKIFPEQDGVKPGATSQCSALSAFKFR